MLGFLYSKLAQSLISSSRRNYTSRESLVLSQPLLWRTSNAPTATSSPSSRDGSPRASARGNPSRPSALRARRPVTRSSPSLTRTQRSSRRLRTATTGHRSVPRARARTRPHTRRSELQASARARTHRLAHDHSSSPLGTGSESAHRVRPSHS